jgi:hypothetical protein
MSKVFDFVKGIIGLLTGDRRLTKALPDVFDKIDSRIPELIGQVAGREIEELIARSIKDATGGKVTKRQVKRVIRLYSPVVAADKAAKKRR